MASSKKPKGSLSPQARALRWGLLLVLLALLANVSTAIVYNIHVLYLLAPMLLMAAGIGLIKYRPPKA